MSGMHHAITAYARADNNCIVDYIAYKPEWITDLVQRVARFNGMHGLC